MLLSNNPDAAADAVFRLDQLEEHYKSLANLHPNRRNHVLAEISVVRIFTVFNDAHLMLDCTNKALELLDGGVSCIIRRDSEFTFGSPHFLYTYYREAGSLAKIVEFMVAEFPAFSKLSDGCGMGCDYITLAEYALEKGDWQLAELNAFKAIYKAQTMGQTGIILCGGLTLIRLYIYQGKISEALEHLHQLRADISKEDNAIYDTTLDLIDGYVYASMANLAKIPEWLRTGDISPANFMFQGIAFNYIVYGKTVLLEKDYVKLEMLTETFPQYFGIFQNQLGFLHNHILAAVAKYRLYGMEAGCARLAEAIRIGRADHLLLSFGEYAEDIIEMLNLMAKNDSLDSYIAELLGVCQHYIESLHQVPLDIVTLTEREKEVLTLAGEGLKREEIAARLYVSVGTVRTHLANIYRKLGVSSRTAAVKKAEKLKIL